VDERMEEPCSSGASCAGSGSTSSSGFTVPTAASADRSAATASRLVRVLLWLAAPAKINRFYLGMLFLACWLSILGWWLHA
jgi:hypothetical protein